MQDQRKIKIKACKPFRNKNVVDYYISLHLCSVLVQKSGNLNELGVWVSDMIIKEDLHKYTMYFFAIVPQCMHLIAFS